MLIHFVSQNRYPAWPALQSDVYGAPRAVQKLVTTVADNQVQAKQTTSQLSMKFFNEKRMFAHHFHALRIRSNKQNVGFKDITSLMTATAEHLTKTTPAFSHLISAALLKDTLETGTTFDQGWGSLKKHFETWEQMDKRQAAVFHTLVMQPLLACHTSTEHTLKLLFEEANRIDDEAGI